MSQQTYVPSLLKLFRQFGYEGVTLAKISQATGLGKASLYHHFPGGKAEMAGAAIAYVNQWLETKILPILLAPSSLGENHKILPIDRFQTMGEEISQFFNEGQNSCLWAVLVLAESSDELFHPQISWAFATWIEAIAEVLITAGLDETLAKERGQDAMITMQGALILSCGLKNKTIFQRVLKQLPQQLCQDI